MLDSPPLHCRFITTWPSVPHSRPNNSLLLPTPYTALYNLQPCNSNSTKFRSLHFSLSLVHGPRPMCFPVSALKKRGKGGVSLTDQSDSDNEFDGDEDLDGDEMLLPLANMREWLAARPRGFGEGKEYDTSIEEKLLQEIEQSRKAQAANINKLKSQPPSNPNSGRNVADKEAPEIANTGVRVRVINLPKKRNIHRDLMLAFKGFPGIVNITPAVIGNKKTRDPICKGFAFVDCKSEGDAISFLQSFSGQYLTFGRVQKQIKCEIMNQQTSNSAREISVVSTNRSRLSILEEEAGQVADMDMDLAGEVERTRVEDIEDNLAYVSELHSDDEDDNGVESRTESKILPPSEKELDKIHELEEIPPQGREEVHREAPPINMKTKVSKKKQPKEKGEKKSSLVIPGSAKRLRIKEKAVLTDVYSRYGKKSAVASKEGN
ncbi:uncharacterized protein LOC111806104 [Cucurbita pepo subsp. pepo]|uniref:uncharacterized protein LOC111806104 n=1 Tax=Cucurbita pepo subsp. pepo TaxID=3664 RepID=UPI000C9D6CE8|nr:uncharacterized protein LOC111806104 [Cucurbita pepo subsp. pepo]XP_023547228.1 uncharacterized protein LOC111806104 [Cucurbita pepo subsp. pepo]